MHHQDSTYNNIVNRSSNLFMTYGLRSITMDDICAQCGISKKTLYTLFENKDELVQKVIQDGLESFGSELKEIRRNGKDAIDELMQLLSFAHKRSRQMQPNLNNDLEKFYPQTYQQVVAFRKDELLHFLISNLERGIEEGLYLDGFNNEIIAAMRLKQLDMLLVKTETTEYDADLDEISCQLNCHYISGISTPKGFKLLKKYTHSTTQA